MRQLLANPAAIIIICLIVAFVLSVNLTLFGLLRGDKRVRDEAAKWARAVGGGTAGQRRQAAEYDELHRVVAALKSPPAEAPTGDRPAGDTTPGEKPAANPPPHPPNE